MVVDTYRLLCILKQLFRKTKAFGIAAVETDEEIVDIVFICLRLHLIRAADHAERLRDILQIDVRLDLRILLLQIHIQSEAGTDAVAVRADMAAQSCSAFSP